MNEYQEQKTKEILEKRLAYLISSDWTQLVDSPLTPEKKQEWAEYRQQLRDITEQEHFPFVQLPFPPTI